MMLSNRRATNVLSRPALWLCLGAVTYASISVGAETGDLRYLRCLYGAPSQKPTDPAAIELAKFWESSSLGGGLFLVYDSIKNQVSIDERADALAKFTKIGAPRPGALPSSDSIGFSIDMLWFADLKKNYSTARYDIRLDLYSLDSEAILEVTKPGQKSEMNKTYWVRYGKCTLKAL